MAHDFALSVDDVLTEAWERCTLSPTILTGDVARSLRRSLQLLLIDWTARGGGLNLWQLERLQTTAVAGQQIVPLATGTVDVLEVMASCNGITELVLYPMSRDQYAGQPNKRTLGRPSSYWSERLADVPVLHLWPVPDRTYDLAVNRLVMPDTIETSRQGTGLPALWSEAVCAAMAARAAQKNKPDLFQGLRALAEDAYANASGEERERVPLTILPSFR